MPDKTGFRHFAQKIPKIQPSYCGILQKGKNYQKMLDFPLPRWYNLFRKSRKGERPMKCKVFFFDEYIKAVEDYISVLDITEIIWNDDNLVVFYN